MPARIYSTEKVYYTYIYLDPRDWVPFLYGKGKDDRLHDHLKETINNTCNKRKFYRIAKLKRLGLQPIIMKHKKGLPEKTAYDLERDIIKVFGRMGYDEGGILLNVCEDNRPPSRKGISLSKIHKKRIGKKK